jgi:hypothetical protein
VGGQIDIAPTLIELAAPKGFTYYSVGQDLLAPRKEFFGIGYYRVIGRDFIADTGAQPPQLHPLPGVPLPTKLPDGIALQKMMNEAYGIGWWRARRGNLLQDH